MEILYSKKRKTETVIIWCYSSCIFATFKDVYGWEHTIAFDGNETKKKQFKKWEKKFVNPINIEKTQ